MEKRHYKSDIDFLMKLPVLVLKEDGSWAKEYSYWPDCDWTARFWVTDKSRAITVSRQGDTLTNCFNDNGRIHVVFDNPGFGCGVLQVEYHLRFPNPIYPDGHRDVYGHEELDLQLTDGAGDCMDPAEIELTIPYAVVDAYNVAVASGFSGAKEEYYAGLNMLPSLSGLVSDLEAGKREIADTLGFYGEQTGPDTTLRDMARMVGRVFREAEERPTPPADTDSPFPDLLDELRRHQCADWPYTCAVAFWQEEVELSGAQAYLCSDGFRTEESGTRHRFAPTESGIYWVIYYFSAKDYAVPLPAEYLYEICVFSGMATYPALKGVERVRNFSEEFDDRALALTNVQNLIELHNVRRIDQPTAPFQSCPVRIFRLPNLEQITLPANIQLMDPANLEEFVMPKLQIIDGGTLITVANTSLRRISLPVLKNIRTNSRYSWFYCVTNLCAFKMPELESISMTISSCSILDISSNKYLKTLSFPELREIDGTAGSYVIVAGESVTDISLPALEYCCNAYLLTGSSVKTLDLPSLHTLAQGRSYNNFISGCPQLREINMPALHTAALDARWPLFRECPEMRVIRLGAPSGTTTITLYPYGGTSESMQEVSIEPGFAVNLNISYFPNLTPGSLRTLTANLGEVTTKRTLTLGAANLAKLTDAEIAAAVAKGWTLTV